LGHAEDLTSEGFVLLPLGLFFRKLPADFDEAAPEVHLVAHDSEEGKHTEAGDA
jgi:hypothetical protein